VVWTLNATLSDGGTATGSIIFDADTGTFSDWKITASGGNTSNFPAIVFSPSNCRAQLWGQNTNALLIYTNALFPDAATGTPREFEIFINPSAPLSDSGGTLNILPGNLSGEYLGIGRLITSGTLSGKPAPDLTVTVTDNSDPYNPIGGSIFRGVSGGTFTVTISNVGTAPTSGAVNVTNVLSAGLTVTGISGESWNCTLSTLACTRSDSLAVAGKYPAITVNVTTSASAPDGVTDTVSVAGGGDLNTTDNTAQDYTTTFTEAQVMSVLTYLKPPADFDATLLMTDGTVLAHEYCTPNWYKLTPTNLGSYGNGTWSQTAPMPAGYGPFAFASAVLPDDRVVVIGGEYNEPCTGSSFDVNLGAIYDPKADSWTTLPGPGGWAQIGDASSVVLPNGQFMLAGNNEHETALLDPVTLTWTVSPAPEPTEEAGWTLLPDGSVLMPDVQQAPDAYRYIPASATWVSAGQTPNWIVTDNEIGPQVLRPDGTVFVAGSTGQTAIYNSSTQTWTAGPTLPGGGSGQLIALDVPGVLEPNGNVLFEAADKAFTFWFEFNGTNLNPTPGEAAGGCLALLPLPNGQIACSGSFVYTPPGSPNPAWAPSIAVAPGVVQPGQTYTITGTQFNGLSQAVGFGDDYQGATNYPLVRIIDKSTGHMFYCRTHHHSTMAVATGSAVVSTEFDVPASIETGASTLEVVANGIASDPVNLSVNVSPGGVPILSGLSPSTAGAGSAAFTLTVNGSGFVSGMAVSWNGIAQPTSFVSGSRLTATISASLMAASGAAYVSVSGANALSNAVAFTIQAAQTITFAPLNNVTLGVAPFTISAMASSGIAVSFTSSTTKVCTVSGSTVTILATGTCSITASAAGNAIYAAATPVTQTFAVTTAAIASVTTADGGPAIAQNTFIVIKGTHLVPAATPAAGVIWSTAPSFASGQMPTELSGVSVTVDNKPAFVYFYCSAATDPACSEDQLNILTPLDNTTGPVPVVVTSGTTPSPAFNVKMQAVAPAFLLFGATEYVAATHANNALVGPMTLYPGASTPAHSGEVIVVYAVGFGLPSAALINGSAAQSGALPVNPVCTVGGNAAAVVFAGLSAPGLYQLNLTIPAGAANGDNPISCTYGGANTPAGDLITVGP